MAKIQIFREMDHKRVGEYDTETCTYYRKLRGGQHIYQSPPSICTDVSILNQLHILNCRYIHLYNSATKSHYWTTIKLVWEKGFRIPDYGYGFQWALPLAYWFPSKPQVQEEMKLTQGEKPEPPSQPNLF